MKDILAPQNIAHAAREEHGVHLDFEASLHGGVSGDVVYQVRYTNGDNEAKKGVIKIGDRLGEKEMKGAKILGGRLPLIQKVVHGRDYVLYPYIQGENINSAVLRNKPEANSAFEQFAQLHARLWEETEQSGVELIGYPQKMEQTKETLFGTSVVDVHGKTVPLCDLADHEWTVNGKSIGSLTEVWEQTNNFIRRAGKGAITHGDEGAGNGMIRDDDKHIIILDHGSAGLRAPEESIAKILVWFDATATKIQGYQMEYSENHVRLETETALSPHIADSITTARKQLEPWMSQPQDMQQIAAYMLTCLWREMQWLPQRGREVMKPYLLAKSLSLAQAFDGKTLPFPLSLKDEGLHRTDIFLKRRNHS